MSDLSIVKIVDKNVLWSDGTKTRIPRHATTYPRLLRIEPDGTAHWEDGCRTMLKIPEDFK